MPAPFKIVHDNTCSANPTLDLPLTTTAQTLTVSGTLTVAGVNIGTTLSSLQQPIWRDGNSFTGVTNKAGSAGFKSMTKNGVVNLAGGVDINSVLDFADGEGSRSVIYLDNSAFPASTRYCVVSGGINGYCVAQIMIDVKVKCTTGGQGTAISEICLDGCSYAVNELPIMRRGSGMGWLLGGGR
jgi:hypothetical protein